MPRRLAQQRMTLSDRECLTSTSSASRAISAAAELASHVCFDCQRITRLRVKDSFHTVIAGSVDHRQQQQQQHCNRLNQVSVLCSL